MHFYLYFNICLRKQSLSTSSTSGLMGDVAFTEITNTVSAGRNLISVSADSHVFPLREDVLSSFVKLMTHAFLYTDQLLLFYFWPHFTKNILIMSFPSFCSSRK